MRCSSRRDRSSAESARSWPSVCRSVCRVYASRVWVRAVLRSPRAPSWSLIRFRTHNVSPRPLGTCSSVRQVNEPQGCTEADCEPRRQIVIRKLVIPLELGEAIEVRVLDWLRAPGDEVNAGDALLEFETDKAIVLVTAVRAGALRRCFFASGDWMKPGDVAAWLSDSPDEPLPDNDEAVDDTVTVTFDIT